MAMQAHHSRWLSSLFSSPPSTHVHSQPNRILSFGHTHSTLNCSECHFRYSTMSLLHQTTQLAGANAVRFRRSCSVKAKAHGTSSTTLDPLARQPRPPFPLPAKIFYSLMNVILRFAKRRDGTLNRRCISFLDAVQAPPDPDGGPDGVATSDHVVDPARNLSVRYYSPPPPGESRDGQAAAALPVVVYFHGGGFVTGSAAAPQFDGFCRRLSKQLPARVVSVDYRLAPEHRYPAPCDDGVAVLRWLDSGRGLFIDDLSAVFLAGDSAGGNIAHHVARRATAEEGYERTKVLGLVAIQPFFGGEEDTESERRLPFVSRRNLKWLWRIYLPEGSDSDHQAANVFGPPGSSTTTSSSKGEWTHFPATMVVVGGLDSFQDRQRWYYQGLKRMGVEACLVEYPNAIHSFHVLPGNADAQQLVQDVGDFVRRKCEEAVWTRRSLAGWKWIPEVCNSSGFFHNEQ